MRLGNSSGSELIAFLSAISLTSYAGMTWLHSQQQSAQLEIMHRELAPGISPLTPQGLRAIVARAVHSHSQTAFVKFVSSADEHHSLKQRAAWELVSRKSLGRKDLVFAEVIVSDWEDEDEPVAPELLRSIHFSCKSCDALGGKSGKDIHNAGAVDRGDQVARQFGHIRSDIGDAYNGALSILEDMEGALVGTDHTKIQDEDEAIEDDDGDDDDQQQQERDTEADAEGEAEEEEGRRQRLRRRQIFSTNGHSYVDTHDSVGCTIRFFNRLTGIEGATYHSLLHPNHPLLRQQHNDGEGDEEEEDDEAGRYEGATDTECDELADPRTMVTFVRMVQHLLQQRGGSTTTSGG